ncbi:class I SAM-dependent methyltransferase [Nocardioides terrisoli]|uniref:class I SAM-dependent methyltransferase n=1 Tax=Nocardioides terrisoli TaxID=3388267 RepID=UPI00287B65ED|nr:class I SAM-dependent methyltransferase [Nocardioides marmorisolisilvae]
MKRDWHAWHQEYDDPVSSLSRRLEVIRHELDRALSWLETEGVDHPRLVSLCAGDGRDVLPVLAAGHPTVSATLVENDAPLADRARAEAARLGLSGVDVRTADAGVSDSVRERVPAHLLMACGVFGNVPDADVLATVQSLPHLLAGNALVIWTRGHRIDPRDPSAVDGDPSTFVRQAFLDHGFCEVAFVRPEDASYRVGVSRFTGQPAPYADGLRMFTFR